MVTRRFVDNAWRRGCDFINLDLEDSVPQHLKGSARELIKEAIANVSKGGAEVFTRINHDLVQADLEAIIWPGLSKVNYPKAEYASRDPGSWTTSSRTWSESVVSGRAQLRSVPTLRPRSE